MSSEEKGRRKINEEITFGDKAGENNWKLDVSTQISVEPCVFLFMFGMAFINIQMATLYIQKTCKVGSYFFGNQTYSTEVRN